MAGSAEKEIVDVSMVLRDVEAAVRAGREMIAAQLASAALAKGLEHPTLLALRSGAFLRRNMTEPALRDMKRAVEIAPDNIDVRNSYGTLLGQTGQWPEAAEAFENSVQRAPNDAGSRYFLGSAREELGELDAARHSYERAVDLAPGFVEPLPRLATLALNRGDMDAARALSNRALSLRRGDFPALVVQAKLAIMDRDFERAEAIVRRLIAATSRDSLDGAIARGALADLRHAQERYAQAFAAYTARNRTFFNLHAVRYCEGDDAQGYCRWLTQQFSRMSREQWSAKEPATADDDMDGAIGHVFVVGFPRSGTTLLESILAAHPSVMTLDERETLLAPASDFLLDAAGCERLASLDENSIAEYRARYWQQIRYYGVDVRAKVLVDKYPLSTLKLPLVAKLFPKAKVVFAIRDPRDVVLSCFRHHFGINSSTFQFLDIVRGAYYYANVMDLAGLYREKLDLNLRLLRHEVMVENFEEEVRGLCDFVGIPWNASMRDFADHARTRAISTPSASQVVRGLNHDGIGQWRNYQAELAPVLDILAPWIKKFGYT